MFVTNWISTTKIQKISEITNFFRHYFLSRTEVVFVHCNRSLGGFGGVSVDEVTAGHFVELWMVLVRITAG